MRSKGSLRGFEDEKFSYVAFRRGTRPSVLAFRETISINLCRNGLFLREPWPLDGMKFETLKEIHAKRVPEDLEIDAESQFDTEGDSDNTASHDSNSFETDVAPDNNNIEEEEVEAEKEEGPHADLGSGWGRIMYMPCRRGKRVEMDVCRATDGDGTQGSFDRIVITQSKNPTLHHQARRSLWGDLWPLRSGKSSKFYM
ncbi:hypothetical protein OROGR_010485 [Orobanche gracilis]